MTLDIFIPYWGEPRFMKETVRSVLAQDDGDWKLTVVDDAYPTLEVAEFMASITDQRVTYVRKARNEGITANYRTCVSMATEPVMVLLGSDDRLKPSYVRDILSAHERFPNAAIIQPGVELIDENGTIIDPLADRVKRAIQPRGRGYQIFAGEKIATSLLHGDWLYWPALAFRTEVISDVGFREGFPLIQDLAIVMDMIFRGEQLLRTPEVTFQYRRHTNSASSSTLLDGTRFAGEREYFELAHQISAELGWSSAARAARLRLTSRTHAACLIPSAMAARDVPALTSLLRHALGK